VVATLARNGTAWQLARRVAAPAVRRCRRALDGIVARRYGLPREASSIVWLDALGHAGPDRNSYAPTPWGLLGQMLPADEVSEEDVFLDLGCGMGRIVLEAALRYPFARVEGVELAPRLAAIAREVLRRNQHRLRCRGWKIVTSDVLDYCVADDVTIAYLYDPFTGPIFDAAIERLEASVERRPRRLRVVYVVPQESERLQRAGVEVRSGSFGLLKSGAMFRYLVCDLLPARVPSR
jgi:SAM-dependent methyltransferase